MRNVNSKSFKKAMIDANYDSFMQLGKDAEIDNITLSNICNNKQKPSYDTIVKLADALHLSYVEIGEIFFCQELA